MAGAAGSVAGGFGSVPARPMNVVFILIDDMGWADLGCYGSRFHETPRIDRFAAESMRFTNATAACPVCSPTRASILTGKHPARLQLTDWIPGNRTPHRFLPLEFAQHLPDGEVTIAESLRQAGYRTALIGKWHLGAPPHTPERFGFQRNVAGCERGSPPSYFTPYQLQNLEDGPEGEYLTDRLTEEAVRFLEESDGRPFFLYFPHYAVHNPMQGKAAAVERFRRKLATMPPPAGPRFKPEGPRQCNQVQENPVYAAMVESVDESVGRVLDTLRRLGREEDTVVVFFSDNGGLSTSEGSPTSNVPLRAGKGWLYEGGIREPLIVRWPGVTRPGSVCETPVCSMDFYPTLLQAAGLPLRPRQHRDGTSLLPLLQGRRPSRERALFWHYPHLSNQGCTPCGAVRLGQYKLVEWFHDGRVELYDLEKDPGEERDLAPREPARAASLRRRLEAWRRAVGARMPERNPDWREP